eukprot:PhF_6_TR5505/c0_g1_i2/m.7791
MNSLVYVARTTEVPNRIVAVHSNGTVEISLSNGTVSTKFDISDVKEILRQNSTYFLHTYQGDSFVFEILPSGVVFSRDMTLDEVIRSQTSASTNCYQSECPSPYFKQENTVVEQGLNSRAPSPPISLPPRPPSPPPLPVTSLPRERFESVRNEDLPPPPPPPALETETRQNIKDRALFYPFPATNSVTVAPLCREWGP